MTKDEIIAKVKSLNWPVLEVYDKSKVGKVLAWGSDHIVREYGAGEVIKFSIFADRLMGSYAKTKALQDLAIAKQFLGEYVLDTRVVLSPNHKRIALIQPKITGHYLCKADLADDSIRQQLHELVGRYRLLLAAGHADLDLVGHKGVFQPQLSNIFVIDGTLRLIDTALLETAGVPWLEPGMWLVRWGVARRQNYILKYFGIQNALH